MDKLKKEIEKNKEKKEVSKQLRYLTVVVSCSRGILQSRYFTVAVPYSRGILQSQYLTVTVPLRSKFRILHVNLFILLLFTYTCISFRPLLFPLVTSATRRRVSRLTSAPPTAGLRLKRVSN